MSDVPRGSGAGEPTNRGPTAQLLPLVYDELRRLAARQLARERPRQTLQATALVHEAYVRLMGSHSFDSKSQFLRAAAEAMRRILVENARRRKAQKRGGDGRRFDLAEADLVVIPDPDTLLAVEEALTALAAEDATAAEVARLRLFAGLSIDETSECLDISRATAFRDWAYARAWLTEALAGGENSRNS
jgi:RNA polymerase sigma factor (TIGR02999 family)